MHRNRTLKKNNATTISNIALSNSSNLNINKTSSPYQRKVNVTLPNSITGSQPQVNLRHLLNKQTNEATVPGGTLSKPGLRTNYNSTHSNMGSTQGQATTSLNPSITAYQTLNQNVKSQYNLRQQQTANGSHQQLPSAKAKPYKNPGSTKIMIKTQCVSLEVSPGREADEHLSLQDKVGMKGGTKVRPGKVAKLTSPLNATGIKIIRKPMISHTMKHSKQPSLNSTPTRQRQEYKQAEEAGQIAVPQKDPSFKPQNSQ